MSSEIPGEERSGPASSLERLPSGYSSWQDYAAHLERLAEESEKKILRLTQERDLYQHRASTDPLTDLWNRAAFERLLEADISHARRSEEPLSLAMFDVDLFKKVNDGYGHQEGDKVLKGFASYLQKSLRGGDKVARYGGEEFAAIMPHTAGETAFSILNRLREGWNSHYPTLKLGPEEVTFSAGVAELQNVDTANSLIYRADKIALYKAKDSGRDCVVLADPPEASG